MTGNPIVLCSPVALSYHHNRHSFALALQRVSATRVIANSSVDTKTLAVQVQLNSLQFERYIYFAMLHLYKHHVCQTVLSPLFILTPF